MSLLESLQYIEALKVWIEPAIDQIRQGVERSTPQQLSIAGEGSEW